MSFFVDESVDHPIVERLRDDGYDVLAVAEMAPSITDETVLAQANQCEDLLLTADKDFGELVFRQHPVTAGFVLIRLVGLSAGAKAGIVSTVILDHGAELLHAFT